ncbi:aspartate 4-decarboxylase [Clostridium sp.]|uniref:aspartate 4-decarboxylase n=1 Tax=Clostridium sp. TaxID=1506 RepID=UPI0026DA9D99|nr:aspartate 4-decarboxylase [Clostridium sp.]MDO5038897.1 aspartate 4-decarboxylase [Clostridium sp.]
MKINTSDIKQIEKVYGKISPFEFKDKLIEIAKKDLDVSKRPLLDAGRGNPNWTCATPRQAFFTFGQFAVLETQRVWKDGDLAGMPHKKGIYNRFKEFADENINSPGIELLINIIEYGINNKNFDADSWVYELTDGIIGDNYPFPDRMLSHIESIVHDYLVKEMCSSDFSNSSFDIFAVEGATAAMCYIFDSLKANELLCKGDRIAIITPVFTPYLEIPKIPRYSLDIIQIKANENPNTGNYSWQVPSEELEKLKDNSIKALFIVNPGNPSSVALTNESKDNLIKIVKENNPNLIIISDDVYGTFVPGFRSLMADLPYNTIGVYSFSKYFGVTGYRLGTIALQKDNVLDKLIRELPKEKKNLIKSRYKDLSTNCDNIPFIDRLVADSRQVALNHTAGLSTPQQVQMAFFCAFALLDKDDNYKKLTIEICRRRKKLLFDGLGIELKDNKYSAYYYTEFNILKWARNSFGEDFANYLQDNYKLVYILYELAKECSIIVLSGSGFDDSEWSLRVSLANLDDQEYYTIGKVMRRLMINLIEEWNSTTK